MTKDDAAVNPSLKAVRCLGNLSDLHCSRDWKCAANRRFQLIKPNLLILRQFPICGEQAMCPWKAGHSQNPALAPPWPVICWVLVGHGHLLTATKGDEGVARGHNALSICTAAPHLDSAHIWQAAERTGSKETSCPPRAAYRQQDPCRVHASTPDLWKKNEFSNIGNIHSLQAWCYVFWAFSIHSVPFSVPIKHIQATAVANCWPKRKSGATMYLSTFLDQGLLSNCSTEHLLYSKTSNWQC